MKKILISAFILPLLFTGCASTGLIGKGTQSWSKAIRSKEKQPLPNPIGEWEVGSINLLYKQKNGVHQPLPVTKCAGAYEGYDIKTVPQLWGKIVESRSYEGGIFIGREDGIASPDITGAVKAGTSTVETYTVDFGTVQISTLQADPYDLKASLSDDCLDRIDKLAEMGHLDNIYVILTAVQAPSINYTFKLNPGVDIEMGIKDSEVPAPGDAALRDYEAACGTYLRAHGKLLKFLALATDGQNCVSGEFSISTSQPFYIAHVTYPATAFKQSDELSDGYVLIGEPATELKALDEDDLPALRELLGE